MLGGEPRRKKVNFCERSEQKEKKTEEVFFYFFVFVSVPLCEGEFFLCSFGAAPMNFWHKIFRCQVFFEEGYGGAVAQPGAPARKKYLTA